MKNIKLTISYDGTKYNGWQKQGNTDNTIQGRLESTIGRFVEEEIELSGSGRTDAGVHARGQVANFKISDKTYERIKSIYPHMSDIREALNEYLPKDIKIIEVKEVDERFHARLNATKKHYSYTIDNALVPDVFARNYMIRIKEKIDVDSMRKAATYLIGEHDFKCFCANKKMKKSTVRTIYEINIKEENGIITIDYFGNGFLYNMVRIMTGTLIEIGLSKRKPEDMIRVMESLDRAAAGFTAPPAGLFLEKVFYERE